MEVLPTPDQELGRRLAGVEDRLDAISERLGRLELSLADTVAAEVHEATAELRRVISELGRRLVQDLPTQLARHRDLIVAEVRAAAPPPPPPAPVPQTEPDATVEPEPEQEPEVVVDGAAAAAAAVADRRRASRLRRRS